MKGYIYNKKNKAENGLKDVKKEIKRLIKEDGYTVLEDDSIIPKKLGVDNYDAAKMEKWAEIIDLTDGKFAIPSVKKLLKEKDKDVKDKINKKDKTLDGLLPPYVPPIEET